MWSDRRVEYTRSLREPQGMAPYGDHCRVPHARDSIRPEPEELRNSWLNLDPLRLGQAP